MKIRVSVVQIRLRAPFFLKNDALTINESSNVVRTGAPFFLKNDALTINESSNVVRTLFERAHHFLSHANSLHSLLRWGGLTSGSLFARGCKSEAWSLYLTLIRFALGPIGRTFCPAGSSLASVTFGVPVRC